MLRARWAMLLVVFLAITPAHDAVDTANAAGSSRQATLTPNPQGGPPPPSASSGSQAPAAATGLPGRLDDGLNYPPPATGPYAYNSFVLSNTAGASYVDPVFGTTVKRLSMDHKPDDSYARNMWWNADGTRYLHRAPDGTPWSDFLDVIDSATGRVTHKGISIGAIAADAGFDPVDPNVMYRFSDRTIFKVILQANGKWAQSAYFTAPSPLKSFGGTLNWMDANGTYMLVRYGAEPSVRVYDRRNLAAGPYANPIDGSTSIDAGSYLALTPDGQYVVGYDSAGGCCRMGRGVSWKIDHATRTVTPALTEFWSLCGDHATFLSASDGRNYMLATNCTNRWEVWRADITNNARGLGEDQQRALPNNKLLKAWPHWENNEVHYSAVAKGPLRDWAFVATEYGADTFNSGTADANGRVTPWNVYRQEIIAVNILTGEMRRLAHHRSRSLSADYYNTPRLTASWGGEYVAWNSNFNQSGSIDAYAVVFGGPSRGGSQAELPRQHPTGPRLAPAGRTGADSPR